MDISSKFGIFSVWDHAPLVLLKEATAGPATGPTAAETN